MAYHSELSTVNCAAYCVAPCVNKGQNLKISLLAGNLT
jgi:hypothetical protein